MRLTLVNQFYPPDLAPTGRLAAALAEHRAAQGDQVTIITGSGRYAARTAPLRTAASASLRVVRLWTPGLGKRTAWRRIIDYGWFYSAAIARALALPRQDIIIALTTPPFIAWAGALHRRLHPSTRLVLWNMDCYPDALTSAGVISERSRLSRFLRWQNRMLFRQMDHVICLDRAMQRLVVTRYVGPRAGSSTTVIPNFESTDRFKGTRSGDGRNLEGILGPTNAGLVVLHAGNAGQGHSFVTVAEAAQMLREDPVTFVFVGGGSKWPWLQGARLDYRLTRWHLLPYQPEEQFGVILANAGCALITLEDAFLGVISPSKLHGALATGLPVLYIGPEGSNVDEAIRRFGCGTSLRHGDTHGATRFLRRLAVDGTYAAHMRQRARDAFEADYTDRANLPKFDAIIDSLLR
jgi:glycosyltransferase involved in cell wall biosynthesis